MLVASEIAVPIFSSSDILAARQSARSLATQAGFSGGSLLLIVTAISELGRNVVEYAAGGEIVMRVVEQGGRYGICAIVRDHGPGIPEERLPLESGPVTGGLRMARRFMDEFEIVSEMGKGTTVTMKKWI